MFYLRCAKKAAFTTMLYVSPLTSRLSDRSFEMFERFTRSLFVRQFTPKFMSQISERLFPISYGVIAGQVKVPTNLIRLQF